MNKKGSHTECSEFSLLERIANGDKEAFTFLYSKYASSLYTFILPFVRHSKPEAEEVIQEVFMKLWHRREKVIHIRSVESYLFRMAKNKLFDLHKQRQARIQVNGGLDIEERHNSAHEDFVFEEYYESAQEIIERLTPQRKRIFLMRTQKEMPIADIALSLKISQSAVKKQLYESIRMVKQQLYNEHGWPMMWWIWFVVYAVL